MKNIITLMICLFTLLANAQEKMNKFHVIDSLSGKPVPAAAITLVRARLSINTEKDGIFIIPGNLAVLRDTVILYAQSYKPRKMLLHELDGRDTIQLAKYNTKTKGLSANYNVDTLLNDYHKREIVHYAGVNTMTANFDYLQMAQQFYVLKPGVSLTSIKLNRLAFGLVDSDNSWTGLARIDKTVFKIRIYDIDPVTHGPGRDLCNKTIEVSKSLGKQIPVNLKKYNIVIPGTSFFVAVEWVRDFYNAGYSVTYNSKGEETRELNYHPALGISPVTGKTLNIWALNFKREWKPYTYFMPFGTDLAMSAVIAY